MLKPASFEPSTSAFYTFNRDEDCSTCGGDVDAKCLCCLKGWCAKCFHAKIPTAAENGNYLRKITSDARVSLGDAFVEGRLCMDCLDTVQGHSFVARHPLTKEPLLYIRCLPLFEHGVWQKATILQHAILWAAQQDADDKKVLFEDCPGWRRFAFTGDALWVCTWCAEKKRPGCPMHRSLQPDPLFPALPRYEYAVRLGADGVRGVCLKCVRLCVFPMEGVDQPLCTSCAETSKAAANPVT